MKASANQFVDHLLRTASNITQGNADLVEMLTLDTVREKAQTRESTTFSENIPKFLDTVITILAQNENTGDERNLVESAKQGVAELNRLMQPQRN